MGSSEVLVVNKEGLDLTVASFNAFLKDGDEVHSGSTSGLGRVERGYAGCWGSWWRDTWKLQDRAIGTRFNGY